MKKFSASIMLIVINLLVAFMALKLVSFEWRGVKTDEWSDVFLGCLFAVFITIVMAKFVLFTLSKTPLSFAISIGARSSKLFFVSLGVLSIAIDILMVQLMINTEQYSSKEIVSAAWLFALIASISFAIAIVIHPILPKTNVTQTSENGER